MRFWMVVCWSYHVTIPQRNTRKTQEIGQLIEKQEINGGGPGVMFVKEPATGSTIPPSGQHRAFVNIGHWLTESKERLGHGKWPPWLKREFR